MNTDERQMSGGGRMTRDGEPTGLPERGVRAALKFYASKALKRAEARTPRADLGALQLARLRRALTAKMKNEKIKTNRHETKI